MKNSCTLNKKQADAGDLEEGDVQEAVDHADADDQLPLGQLGLRYELFYVYLV